MMKRYKWQLLVSSLLVLAPMAAGAIFWNDLPDLMPHHVNMAGEVDNRGSKAFVVFGIPLIMLAIHWLCLVITGKDMKNKDQSRKVMSVVMWILPVMSLFVSGLVYSIAMGEVLSVYRLLPLLLGALFIVIGNYLPKCKQNFTIGIKIKWTLISEKNWNATHRYAGKVWVAGGIGMLACTALPMSLVMWFILGITAVMVILPTVFSYRMFKKQVQLGEVDADAKTPFEKKHLVFTLVMTGIVLAVVAIIMFTGNISVDCDETTFTVNASYYRDLTLPYDSIVWVNYSEETDVGSRMNGFGSARLQMGHFQNEEYGDYTLYAYTGSEAYVSIGVGEEVFVIGLDNAEETKQLFDILTQKIA